MHLLTLDTRLELGPRHIIEPGEYLTTDVVGAQLLLHAGGGTLTPLTARRRFSKIMEAGSELANVADPKILFMRPGGFGDLVLLTPVLREIKRRWPAAHVAVSTMMHCGAVLAGLPFVDEVVPFPLPKAQADTFDAWVFYENAIETNPRAKELHMTELFGEIAGLTDIADLKPEYRVKPDEAIWATEAYPRVNGTRRICVQVGSSARCRVYPLDQLGLVCGQMCQRGWEVFLLGTRGEIKLPENEKLPPNLRNLTDSGLTFRQSCAVLNTADGFVGSDSALLHVAGALAVPAVGLYGPFPWKLRTAHCPTTFALQGKGQCAPCFHHTGPTQRDPFPTHCPSRAKGMCEVLHGIKPERIVAKLAQIMRQIEPLADVVAFEPGV